ncbi:MAG: GYF domain-containing protein, partial [Gemmataceae bacterium]|nr:GYF domain-containing protein [Gemmataceae bacterium]
MNRHWYVSRDGRVFGPWTDAQLKAAAAKDTLRPTDLVNLAGEPKWVEARRVKGLFPAAPPSPKADTAEAKTLETVEAEREPVLAELIEEAEPRDEPVVTAEVIEDEPVVAGEVVEEADEPVAAAVIEDEEDQPAPRVERVTCFACFREVSVEIAPGAAHA